MSRINDALKRAQRAQQKNATPADGARPRLLPVASRTGNAIGWILPGVIAFLIVAASLFIGMAVLTRPVTAPGGQPGVLAAQPAGLAPIPASISTPVPTPVPATNAPTPTPTPPPPPPEPKLQGIVYAATRPWAIVDGQTVHVGDRLGEFRVKEITPHGVTLEKAGGSQKKLGLDK